MNSSTLTRFLVLALLWGSSFTLIKVSLEGLSPAQLVLSRLVLGAAVLVAVAAIRRVALPRTGPSGVTWPAPRCSATSCRSCCCPTANVPPAPASPVS